MSNFVSVNILVEGKTEKYFVDRIMVPYFSGKNIYLHPVILSKSGQKGGDVKFSRAMKDIQNFLKQRQDTYLSIFIDYYGTREWPGLVECMGTKLTNSQRAEKINDATVEEVNKKLATFRSEERFIPYISMYEFEALLFSDTGILSQRLNVQKAEIDKIISDCGSPENIDNSPLTAPSKRLDDLSKRRFRKTTTGIAIAEETGLSKIRKECPIFDNWLQKLETLKAL